jgi:hypothetical protein
MKIALFLTGRISENYENTYNNIIEMFNNCSIDFFVVHCCKDDIIINNMKNIYKPKICETTFISDYKILNNIRGKNEEVKIFNCLNMFHNRFVLFNLFEHYYKNCKVNYDFIINYRFDLYTFKKINLSKMKNNILYLPTCYHYGGFNDQIAIGDVEIMKQYYSLFNNFKEGKLKCIFHPETMLEYHINMLNIETKMFKINYKIIRKKS